MSDLTGRAEILLLALPCRFTMMLIISPLKRMNLNMFLSLKHVTKCIQGGPCNNMYMCNDSVKNIPAIRFLPKHISCDINSASCHLFII